MTKLNYLGEIEKYLTQECENVHLKVREESWITANLSVSSDCSIRLQKSRGKSWDYNKHLLNMPVDGFSTVLKFILQVLITCIMGQYEREET